MGRSFKYRAHSKLLKQAYNRMALLSCALWQLAVGIVSKLFTCTQLLFFYSEEKSQTVAEDQRNLSPRTTRSAYVYPCETPTTFSFTTGTTEQRPVDSKYKKQKHNGNSNGKWLLSSAQRKLHIFTSTALIAIVSIEPSFFHPPNFFSLHRKESEEREERGQHTHKRGNIFFLKKKGVIQTIASTWEHFSELYYPPFYTYLLAGICAHALEWQWYSKKWFGHEWTRLAFPKKFYMDGIPLHYIYDAKTHFLAFGLNVLCTFFIGQLLAWTYFPRFFNAHNSFAVGNPNSNSMAIKKLVLLLAINPFFLPARCCYIIYFREKMQVQSDTNASKMLTQQITNDMRSWISEYCKANYLDKSAPSLQWMGACENVINQKFMPMFQVEHATHSTFSLHPVFLGIIVGLLVAGMEGRHYSFGQQPLRLFFINHSCSIPQQIFYFFFLFLGVFSSCRLKKKRLCLKKKNVVQTRMILEQVANCICLKKKGFRISILRKIEQIKKMACLSALLKILLSLRKPSQKNKFFCRFLSIVIIRKKMLGDFEEQWSKYCEEYISCTTSLDRLLKQLGDFDAQATEEALQEGSALVKDTEKAIRSLENLIRESHALSNADRQARRDKVQSFKLKLEGIKKDFRSIQSGHRPPTWRGNDEYAVATERKQLLQGQQILESTDNALLRGKQIVSQVEEIAVDTSHQVHDQGQQLENVLDELHETNAIQDRARRVMLGMARRMMTDRIIQFFIILIELGIIGLLIWYKFLKK
ncbi:vesicle transport v-snare protein [Reticulomyxa filosa]|uniref:Vesicle transport v-snare protein n=1 Tax=Reticulomyxa filosa TaxID=46433 RepID=X6MGW2_RETFI|nr:vesicle transport v-snare protein [Reticulomyxa filosa]|eukprot:ETO12290.1 vesicle transport v-snare protein [Reticulomyxa filosa]